MLAGFAGAVALRLVLGGLGPARSVPAGMAFAVALGAMAGAHGTRLRVRGGDLTVAAAGAAVLCLPRVAARLAGAAAHPPAGPWWGWAVAVAVVAAAEEAFLRGALWDAVERRAGRWVATAVAAVAFAALHVPLYGWHVVPLDLAVGAWLGGLRSVTGSWEAPAAAHVLADWAGWWLR